MSKNIEVTVITNTELGWDCVCGVEKGHLEKEDFQFEEDEEDWEYQDDSYVFSHTYLDID